MDWGRLAVPSVLYTVQNSLQYTAMSMLSAPVFQVCYQMKIVTTALFSVVLLNRHITPLQWGSVSALAMGVALVQLSQQSGEDDGKSSSFLGLIAVAVGCMTSGFAGVYFEMVLKSSRASIWVRNIQLAFIGIFMASCGCLMKDYDGIFPKEGGFDFFHGYNSIVWGVILFQAAGGSSAMVVKYANNIIKTSRRPSASFCLPSERHPLPRRTDQFLLRLGESTVMGATYAFGYAAGAVVSRQTWSCLWRGRRRTRITRSWPDCSSRTRTTPSLREAREGIPGLLPAWRTRETGKSSRGQSLLHTGSTNNVVIIIVKELRSSSHCRLP